MTWQEAYGMSPQAVANMVNAARATAAKQREALDAAKQFIENGVELGYIRLPDQESGDPALLTLPKICAALNQEPKP